MYLHLYVTLYRVSINAIQCYTCNTKLSDIIISFRFCNLHGQIDTIMKLQVPNLNFWNVEL